jgi:hypothetical protein
MSFEQGFADAERSADNTLKSLAKLATETRRFQKASRLGDIGGLRRSSRQLATLIDAMTDEVGALKNSWPFDESGERTYLEGPYVQELRQAAQAAGLALFERDGQLICPPSIIRVQPADRSVRVDRRRVARLRPSALIAELKANQAKPPRFQPQAFLELLYEAYVLLTEAGRSRPGLGMQTDSPVIQLERVYRAFRLGAGRDYERTDFARDLYLLDSSRVTKTRSGPELSLPASTGTKGGRVFQFVTPRGDVVTYYGIRFA